MKSIFKTTYILGAAALMLSTVTISDSYANKSAATGGDEFTAIRNLNFDTGDSLISLVDGSLGYDFPISIPMWNPDLPDGSPTGPYKPDPSKLIPVPYLPFPDDTIFSPPPPWSVPMTPGQTIKIKVPRKRINPNLTPTPDDPEYEEEDYIVTPCPGTASGVCLVKKPKTPTVQPKPKPRETTPARPNPGVQPTPERKTPTQPRRRRRGGQASVVGEVEDEAF